MINLQRSSRIQMVIFFILMVLVVLAPVVYADAGDRDAENHGNNNSGSANSVNKYSTVFSNGDTFTMSLSLKKVGRPGNSSIRNKLDWTESGSFGTISGGSYSLVWSDFENGAGGLYEDDPAHGASFNLIYAFPTATCSNGVMYFAAVQTIDATSISHLGNAVSFTPLFGQICGTPVTGVNAYVLTKVTSNSTGTGNSTGTTSTTGGTGMPTGTTSTTGGTGTPTGTTSTTGGTGMPTGTTSTTGGTGR